MTLKQRIKASSLYPAFRSMRRHLELLGTSCSMIVIKFFCAVPSKHIRLLFLNCHKDVNIHRSVPVYHGFEWWKGPLSIGKGSSIGFRNHLDCRMGVEIGRNVCLASDVTIWTLHHDYNDESFRVKGGKVTIGDYAWLCSNCIILPGVIIGEGAVVAAGAVVCGDVAPWSVVGGVPARVIAERERKTYNYCPGDYWLPMI